jgi:hypothetical protein
MSTLEEIASIVPSLTKIERQKLLNELLTLIQDESTESFDEDFEDLVSIDTPLESMIDTDTGELHIRFPLQIGVSNRLRWRIIKITPAAQLVLLATLTDSIKVAHKKLGSTATKIQ